MKNRFAHTINLNKEQEEILSKFRQDSGLKMPEILIRGIIAMSSSTATNKQVEKSLDK